MTPKKRKKVYEAPEIQQVRLERAVGDSANCKTSEPTGTGITAYDCDGLIGSPPPGPCLALGS